MSDGMDFSGSSDLTPPRPSFRTGASHGRYTITGHLGAGGMGEVYAAYDPELDRELAIKVLRPGVGGASLGDRTRFLREAQALAKLNHPNVVTVFDVGTVDEQVFVAMERVEGISLQAWLQERPRTWREVRDVFLAAGRGLEAAHAHGIVHRDFKPHNVMVGEGRVVVLDFGLARRAGEPADSSSSGAVPRSSLDVPLTQTGDVVGTPAYMAPEQLAGLPASVASDQWSFCVALHEGLFGSRPFRGTTLPTFLEATRRGLPALPSRKGVPRRLAALVARGLAPEADRRFPSMTALLAELARDPARRVRFAVAGAGVVALVAAAALVAARGASPVDPCGAGAGRLAGVWDEPARVAVRDAFGRVGRPFAADAFARTAALLDAHAADLTAMHREACQATLVRGEQSHALMDARMQCLDRRRGELRALARSLAGDLQPAAAGAAIASAARLTPVAVCADADALAARVPLPDDPAARAEVLELDGRVAEVDALLDATRLEEARGRADVLTRAAQSAHAPLRARALLVEAKQLLVTGDTDGGRARLEAAVEAATEGRDDVIAAEAWLWLVRQRARKGRYQEALDLALSARAAIKRAGDDPGQLVLLLTGQAGAALRLERIDEGQAHVERALAVARAMRGPGADVALARALSTELFVHQLRHDPEARDRTAHEYAVVVARAYGPAHEQAGLAEMALANVASAAGRLDDVEQRYRRAQVILAGSVGAESYGVGSAHFNLGLLMQRTGRHADALAELERAHAIWVTSMGPEHPDIVAALTQVGVSQRELGRRDEARATFERAALLSDKVLPPNHDDALELRSAQVELALAEGRAEEALAVLELVLAAFEEKVDAADPRLVGFLRVRAIAQRKLGRAAQALPDLERALALSSQSSVPPLERAQVRWELAQSLAEARRDARRARALAREAERMFAEAKDDAHATEVAAWLAARR